MSLHGFGYGRRNAITGLQITKDEVVSRYKSNCILTGAEAEKVHKARLTR